MGPFNSYTSTNGQRVKAGVLPSELKKDKIVPSYTQIKNKQTLLSLVGATYLLENS